MVSRFICRQPFSFADIFKIALQFPVSSGKVMSERKERVRYMPTGIITNALSIAAGGVLGALAGHRVSEDFKTKIQMIFGVCSMAMGISSIVLMKNMPAVIFAVIIGTAMGLFVRLEEKINRAGAAMQKVISKIVPGNGAKENSEEFMATLITVIVLFCASGTGIYGSIVSGMSGDHSILIAKSILDLFTAMIFACSLGMVVAVIAVPQFFIFWILFMCAGLMFPLTTPEMIDDFKACGGILMLATGFRMIKVKMFPTADMIPAMVIVMPISYLWSMYILPLVS